MKANEKKLNYSLPPSHICILPIYRATGQGRGALTLRRNPIRRRGLWKAAPRPAGTAHGKPSRSTGVTPLERVPGFRRRGSHRGIQHTSHPGFRKTSLLSAWMPGRRHRESAPAPSVRAFGKPVAEPPVAH